jgi:hypothetical protein
MNTGTGNTSLNKIKKTGLILPIIFWMNHWKISSETIVTGRLFSPETDTLPRLILLITYNPQMKKTMKMPA